MKIATWNVNSLKVRLPQVLQWLEQNPVEILALQELKLDQDKFPVDELSSAGYQAVWFGQKTYNGVALLVRNPLMPIDVIYGIPNYEDIQRRVISATINNIRVICVYCVNGEAVGSEKFQYKLEWFEQLTLHVQTEMQKHQNLVLLGDFNIAPKDLDVYNPEAWQDKVLCSTQERAAFNKLIALGLHDSLRETQPNEPCYSWWDYRQAMFRRNLGMRIDHILISAPLLKNMLCCEVDKQPRAWERPSDHAPVLLSLASRASG